MSFDNVIQILKLCENIMLNSKFEAHLSMSLKSIKQILKYFNEKIITAMKTYAAIGSDINEEQRERKQKCDAIIEKMKSIA